MPNKKQKKKGLFSRLFDRLDKKLVEKSKKKKACSCCGAEKSDRKSHEKRDKGCSR